MKEPNKVVAVIAVVFGIFFFITGVLKLAGWEWAKHRYLSHLPPWVYYASAWVELGGGLGLIWRPTRLPAAAVILVMIVSVAVSWQR